ncbi:hypothetical protein ACMAZE_13880 [Pseudopelagicola sp. nBUS_20]|uniref:hypothetical protein n=1 Tax=Pseudopelagicola sp. nBUS_20 TaxID=3395317 RepID=UPI003EBA5E4A
MKRFLFVAILVMVTPASAQTEGDGLNLMEEGLKLFFKGLQQEVEPAIKGLQDFAGDVGPELQSFFLEMGPAFRTLMQDVEDWSSYHPPELLPNGDIILRRKVSKELNVPKGDETDI